MKTLAFTLLLLTSHLSAVLPPFWHDASELQAMLSDPKLQKVVDSSEAILEIKQWEKGWKITTTKQVLEVEVKIQPQNRPGPARFSFDFTPTQQ